jgi:AmmeMemoRadiSam system protein B
MRAREHLASSILAAATAGIIGVPATATGDPPSRAEVEATMGLPSEGDLVRGQMDTVGFALRASVAEEVVATAFAVEEAALAQRARELPLATGDGLVGGICPHDDHLYAARVSVHLTEGITAPRVILIGVFHKAAQWSLRDRLVFDSFEAWHAPWGPLRVDPLREELLAALPRGSSIVDNAMHCREHSLEALLAFLQRGRPGRSIVPILVPHTSWARIEELSDQMAAALAAIMKREGWQLGRDLAIVISSDAVHYGPDFDHAPFGTDTRAYELAAGRDRDLIAAHLEGPLDSAELEALFAKLVDPATLDYRVPWCGRFSIPFGLELLRKTALATDGSIPVGRLLRYGTSISEPVLPVATAVGASGLGFTAPSNLHHWVGYAAVGYTLEDR